MSLFKSKIKSLLIIFCVISLFVVVFFFLKYSNEKKTNYFLKKARKLYQQKKYEEALKNHTKAISCNPKSAEALNGRAVIYLLKEKPDKAISDLNKALEIYPDSQIFILNRVSAYRLKKEYEKALKDLDRVIELYPRSYQAYFEKGLILSETGQYKKSIEPFNNAIQYNYRNKFKSVVYTNRGTSFGMIGLNRNENSIHKGYLKKAFDDYEKAMELDSINPFPYYNIASLSDALGNKSKAIEFYKKYVSKVRDIDNIVNHFSNFPFYRKEITQSETKAKIRIKDLTKSSDTKTLNK